MVDEDLIDQLDTLKVLRSREPRCEPHLVSKDSRREFEFCRDQQGQRPAQADQAPSLRIGLTEQSIDPFPESPITRLLNGVMGVQTTLGRLRYSNLRQVDGLP